MVQTSITDTPERAYAGMPADSSDYDAITAVLATSAGVTAGRMLVRNGTTEGSCKVPAAASDLTSQKVLGLVMRDTAREPNAFAQYDTLSIMRKGRIWVPIENAFVVGDSLYVRKAVTTTELLGAIRTNSDSGKAVRVPGVVLTAGDAGDFGLIEINFPYPQEVDEVQESTVESGTFTPTITTGTNTTASSGEVGWYTQIGDVVHFTIRASVTHTAGAPTASTFGFSLPVASALAAAGDLAAVVTGEGVSLGEGQADTANDRGTASYSITGTGAKRVTISGSYTVL